MAVKGETGAFADTSNPLRVAGAKGESVDIVQGFDTGETVVQSGPYPPATEPGTAAESATLGITSTDTGSVNASTGEGASVATFLTSFITDYDSSHLPSSLPADAAFGVFADAQSISATLSSAETGALKDGR